MMQTLLLLLLCHTPGFVLFQSCPLSLSVLQIVYLLLTCHYYKVLIPLGFIYSCPAVAADLYVDSSHQSLATLCLVTGKYRNCQAHFFHQQTNNSIDRSGKTITHP